MNHIDENGRLLCRGACPVARALATGETIRAKVYPLHKAGHRFPVMTHIAPLRDAEGHIIAAIEVFRDISQVEGFRILQEKFSKVVQKYVSHKTFEEMMAQARSGAEGSAESLDLTIFYLDVVGFTPLSEKYPPQDVVRILNDLFGICEVITTERHGDIDKFIGDAVLAVFIDANDAVAAAHHILVDSLPHFNQIRAEAGQEPIRVRIGINSGIVLQGDIGSPERKGLTVIGDVVNTAQRIQTACEPNMLLFSEGTHARLSPETAQQFISQGEVHVRGKEIPVRVFRLPA